MKMASLFTRAPQRYLIGVATVLVALVAFWPVNTTRVVNTPKEEAQYIRRIFEEHTVGQSFHHDYYTIHALEVVVRGERSILTTLVAVDEQGRELGRTPAAVTTDDQWLRIPFESPLPKGRHTITLRTDPPLTREHALLVRMQPQSNRYDEGEMLVDGQASYGDIAFRTIERVPIWKALLIWGQVNDTSLQRAGWYVLWGVVVAAIIGGLALLKTERWPQVAAWIPLVLIFIIAVAVRMPYLEKIEGIFGGDALNYLSKAHALLLGEDPFASDPRKGPFYSFLLLPGFATLDPLRWSRWIGILAAAVSASLLPLMARRVGIPWSLALMSGALLAVNLEFIWEAPSGLAMTVFTFLILLASFAYLEIKRDRRWLWVLAVVVGLVMLTRFEGALVGAILLPAAWVRYRISWRQMLPALAIAGLLMAVPFLSFFWSGQLGIRTASDISSDEGLFLVRSIWDIQLWHNIERSYEFFANLWVWRGKNVPVGVWLGIGMLTGFMLLLFKWKLPRVMRLVLPGLGLASGLFFLFLLTMNNEINRELLSIFLWLLTGIGVAAWLWRQPFDATVLMITVLTQVATIIWILPKGRYFLPTVPFISLALVYGVALFVAHDKWRQYVLPLLFLGCASVFFYFDGHKILEARAIDYNGKAQDTAVMLNAVRLLRQESVRVGIHPTGDLPAILYIPPSRRMEFKSDETTNTSRHELQWMHDNSIERLLERDREPQWASVQEYPGIVEHTQTFDSRFGDSTVFVHRINRAKLTELLQ